MLIERVSQATGVFHTMEIPVTQEQLNAFSQGMLIQRAMPNLSEDEREFIMTGITAEEWGELFSEEEI